MSLMGPIVGPMTTHPNRPIHRPRPRPRAGAWQSFCRARRNALRRGKLAQPAPARSAYRQLSLTLPPAEGLGPWRPLEAHKQPSRRVKRPR